MHENNRLHNEKLQDPKKKKNYSKSQQEQFVKDQ